jgi:hypothetical protein
MVKLNMGPSVFGLSKQCQRFKSQARTILALAKIFALTPFLHLPLIHYSRTNKR